MKVIKHGNKYKMYSGKCKCGCEIESESKEVQIDRVTDKYPHWVICPECDKIVGVTEIIL